MEKIRLQSLGFIAYTCFVFLLIPLTAMNHAIACDHESWEMQSNHGQDYGCFSTITSQIHGALSIDSLDTVYLDMSQAQFIGNQVLVPAWFDSDDQVFAFDFAFRYDHTRLEYDTILTTAAGASLLTNSYLNPNDSIVRFTSSQFTALPNAQPIALVRFNLIGTSALDTSDLFNLVGYLNGDQCSERIIPPGVTSLLEIGFSTTVKLIPNPASDNVIILSSENAQLDIFDIMGSLAVDRLLVKANQELKIPTNNWPAGKYLMVFSNGLNRRTYKLVVSH